MTREQFKAWVNETFPDNVTRAISENDLRDGLDRMADHVFDTLENMDTKVNSINSLVFPMKKGFVYAALDTNFSATPKMQVYYNDGTAQTKGDLYTWPIEQLKNLI